MIVMVVACTALVPAGRPAHAAPAIPTGDHHSTTAAPAGFGRADDGLDGEPVTVPATMAPGSAFDGSTADTSGSGRVGENGRIEPVGVPELYDRTIVRGDTLWDIAIELTGDGLNYPAIWDATDMSGQTPRIDPANPDLIYPGNVVQVPTSLMPGEVITQVFGPDLTHGTDEPAGSEVTDPIPDTTPPSTSPSTPPAPARPATGHAVATTPPAVTASTAMTAEPVPAGQGPSGSLLLLAAGGGGLAAAGGVAVVAARRRSGTETSGRSRRLWWRPARRDRVSGGRFEDSTGHELWPADVLVAGWRSLLPAEPGASQPWCVRWNADLDTLECAWTDDPSRHLPTGHAPTVPGPDSPWAITVKTDRDGVEKQIWSLDRDHVPPEAPADVVPAMVNCASGRGDQQAGDGFFLNLESVGAIAIESSDPDELDPAGVARALLAQMTGGAGLEVHLLGTDLGYSDVRHQVHTDPLQLESQLVQAITANQHLWDQADSIFELRTAGHYHGPTLAVIGPADDLQSCSHLLSLARTSTIPLIVIALGPLSHAWASLMLEPEPDKHTIGFPATGAVLTFDHLSWATPHQTVAVIDVIAGNPTRRVDGADLDPNSRRPHTTSAPATHRPRAGATPAPPTRRPWATGPLTGTTSAPDPGTEDHDLTEGAGFGSVTESPLITAAHDKADDAARNASPAAPTAANDNGPVDHTGDADPVSPDNEPGDETDSWMDDLWDTLADADPTSLADPGAEPRAPREDDESGSEPDTGHADAVGVSGLRLELFGPIRLLERSPDGAGLTEVPVGRSGGLSVGQLSLLAFLGYHGAQPGGGVTTDTIATEFWPTYNPDGTLRHVKPETVKSRIWELRRALAHLIDSGDAKTVLPDASDQRYQLQGVTCDLTELKAAIIRAEANQPGSAEHTETAHRIASLIRPPGLLTPPTGRNAKAMYAWTDNTQTIQHDLTRRLTNILADHANHLTASGLPGQALAILGNARTATPTYTLQLADALVTAYLALDDPLQAETECLAYERQLTTDPRQAEPPPSSPRAKLDAYLNRPPVGTRSS
jgi:hypothetical protein